MRSKSFVAVATVAVLFTLIGCSKKEDAKVETTVPVTEQVDETSVECPEQLVVDAVNDEFDKVSSGEDADVEAAYDVMAGYIPEALKADFEIVQDAAVEAADLISGIDPTKSESELTTAEAADLEAAQDLMSSTEVEDAQAEVKEYFREECPDIVFSEEKEKETTTTTEEVVGVGLCPTEAEAVEVNRVSARLEDESGVVDDALIDDLSRAFDIQAMYVPSDLKDDVAATKAAAVVAFSSLKGLTYASLDDPTTLSPEDKARVEAFLAAVEDPTIQASSDAVDEYFDQTCPDLDI